MNEASDVIIHLGAGMGASTSLYNELGYKKLILVEASVELANILNRKFLLTPNTKIENIAVSANSEKIQLNHYSNPRYNSQLAINPDFIKNSNLQLLEKRTINTKKINDITAEFQLTSDQHNTLIIELNGFEDQFLSELPITQLYLFKKIIVGLQQSFRYLNQTQESSLSSGLSQKGYRIINSTQAQITYEKDPQHLALLRTQSDQAQLIAELRGERDISLAEIMSLKQSLSRTTKERDEHAQWHKIYKEKTDSLQREIEILKRDYAEGEQAQSLTLKLQAKAQVDLDHLRIQYQQKLQQEQSLIELIRELQLKLQAAANYYDQLQLQHPELITEGKINAMDEAIDVELISEPTDSKHTNKKHK